MVDHVAGGGVQRHADQRADARARLEYAQHALRRARTDHALAIDSLDRVQASAEQRRIDLETAATRRSVGTLTDTGALRSYPWLSVLDPYFLAGADQDTLLQDALDAALTHSSADMGNVQLFQPDRRRLHLTAHRGFEHPFLDFFEWVGGHGSACAAALVRRAEVVVPDVEHSPLFSGDGRDVMLDARVVAVHSVPMVSSTGQFLGVFSCHYGKVGRPRADDMQLVSVLAQAVVRSLQWQGHQPGQGAAPHNHNGRLIDQRGVLKNGSKP